LRNGLFFDFESLEWTHYTAPTTPNQSSTSALFTYQGKPTIFGALELGNPQGTAVLQYNDKEDNWATIGYMANSRSFQEVIAIPPSFCSYYE